MKHQFKKKKFNEQLKAPKNTHRIRYIFYSIYILPNIWYVLGIFVQIAYYAK